MNKFWAGKCFRRVLFTCGSMAEVRDVMEQLLLLLLLTGTARCHESCKCFPVPGVLPTELFRFFWTTFDLEQL